MLVHRSVVAPLPNGPRRPLLRTFRWTLPLDQLLQVNPLSLRLGEQRGTRLRRKVADDNTALTVSTTIWKGIGLGIPDEERKNNDTTHQVVDQEEDRVTQGCVRLRLQAWSCDTRRNP